MIEERFRACSRPARAYQEAFRPLFEKAARRGMDVFVTADLQWATPPLRAYAAALAGDQAAWLAQAQGAGGGARGHPTPPGRLQRLPGPGAGRGRCVPGQAGAQPAALLVPPLRRRALRAALPWLSRRLDLLPSIFFETGPALTEWTS